MKTFLSGLRIASFFVIASFSICNLFAEANKVTDDKISTSVPTGANMLVKGKISETIKIPFDRIDEYTFTALLDGQGKYSMQLFQNGTNIAEAYSDTKDSFFFNPQGSARVQDGKDGIPIYWIRMYPTPYPFKAPQPLQLAWIVLNGNNQALDQVAKKYPPGLVFSDLQFERLNWYECVITNAVYDQSEYERLLSFNFRAPGHTLSLEEELLKAGFKEEWLDNLRKTPLGDAYIVPIAGKQANGYDVYSYTTTGVIEGFPFVSKAKMERYALLDPINGEPEVGNWYSLSIESAEKTQQSIEPPKFPASPYPFIHISDYRFEGIQGNCFDCQYKGNDWPFLGTEGYSYIKKERIRYIACKVMNTLSNENRLHLCAEIIEFLISSPPFLFL